MGEIKEPQQVLPIAGVIFTPDFTADIFKELTNDVGDVILKSDCIPFTHTTYYTKEMGSGLTRQWCAFSKLVAPDILVKLKHKTNEIEKQHLNEKEGREVNIDPGLLSLSSLILASTKNYSHRVYLDQGIYAEVTLLFKNQQFNPLEWTYPDYRDKTALDFFTQARDILRERLGERETSLSKE
jgi:hypothetical protein